MRNELTARTEALISQLFAPEEQRHVRAMLSAECNQDALGCAGWTESDMERIWFAILKLASEGQEIKAVARLARTDWRDVLVQAQFATDLNAHEKWHEAVQRLS
ncbi:MAG: hypothetical protein EOO28_33160 [Comamonadaceae bacterium]|nr:MAG: hypothetical protein EOO28_33160 [Comamonadaceae bacterium]